MVTKPFFQNFDYLPEQEMLNSLVVEAIQIYGQDMMYLPRRRQSFDDLYYEDDLSKFDTFYTMEMYVKTAEGFTGEQSFLSSIGLEIRDQIVLSIARTRFEEEITQVEADIKRPREGDLIYFPLNNKTFKIVFVDDKPFFYQFGTLQMYDVTLELFEYANEIFETGIPEIDILTNKFSRSIYDYAILSEDGDYLVTEDGESVIVTEEYAYRDDDDPVISNDEIQEEQETQANNGLIDFSENNPFSSGNW